MNRSLSSIFSAVLLGGCAMVEPVQLVATPPDFATACQRLEATGKATRALRWFRTSAEQQAAFHQAFQLATRQLEAAVQGRAPGTWAVISDADETLIDNSPLECDSQLRGETVFNDQRFNQWVEARQAAALPGAVAFSAVVQALGGHLIVVSNRSENPHLQATRDNLAAIGIKADAVLLKKDPEDRNKNRRFQQVEQRGVPEAGLPPMPVLLYLGDNIRDFPDLSPTDIGDPGRFGTRYVMLPNPVYGSWEKNPLR